MARTVVDHEYIKEDKTPNEPLEEDGEDMDIDVINSEETGAGGGGEGEGESRGEGEGNLEDKTPQKTLADLTNVKDKEAGKEEDGTRGEENLGGRGETHEELRRGKEGERLGEERSEAEERRGEGEDGGRREVVRGVATEGLGLGIEEERRQGRRRRKAEEQIEDGARGYSRVKSLEHAKLRDEDKGQNFQVPIFGILNICKTVIVVIALSGIILGLVPVLLSSYFVQESGTQKALVFKNSLNQLQASFPHQTPRFWRILRNRAAAHLKNPNPKKPLVFMFTAPQSAHDVLQCIARIFAQSLGYEDYGKGVIDSIDYTDYSSPDDAKKYLDDNLKQILQKGQNLLVLDVDKLPVQSPLLFYEYCDNENAPFKHAAIIFTVRLPSEPDPSLAPAKKEGLVAEYLREFWGKQDYRKDDVPPLVARMTDTVVMVKKESNEDVKRNCDT